MKELYVVVHEGCIFPEYMVHPIIGSVMRNIWDIKNNHEWVAIDDFMAPNLLNPSMPEPSNDLIVFVSGAFTDLCVRKQVESLREHRYDARTYLPGCLSLGQLIKVQMDFLDWDGLPLFSHENLNVR